MKKPFIQRAQRGALLIFLLLPFERGQAQFVELTAEIEINDWNYWLLTDRNGASQDRGKPPSIFSRSHTRRCVIGTNTWMIESASENSKVTWWFTGTNIIQHSVMNQQIPEATSTRTFESVDGNPGQPVRVADLMSFDFPAAVCWQTFCSGPVLKREGRQIFPPSAFWKESSIADSGWTDRTEVFSDGLGLPKSINLVTTNNQSIFQYQVRRSTNMLGWNFPLEFYGIQYLPTPTNGWKLELTVKGKVTAISVGAEPQIPVKVMKAASK